MAEPFAAPRDDKSPAGALMVVAVANFVLGGMQLCWGIAVTAALTLLAGVFGETLRPAPSDPRAAQLAGTVMGLVANLGLIFSFLVMVFSGLFLLAGYGIYTRRRWGRILTLILGALSALFGLAALAGIRNAPVSALGNMGIGVGYCIFVYAVLLNREYADDFV